MSNISPRDQNNRPAGLAVNELGTVQPLMADTATGRLLVTVTSDGGGATGVTGSARRDQNQVPSLLALSNDGSGTLIPLATDASGNILCDAIFT